MSVFEAIFDLPYTDGEQAVCCPFPHENALGEYYESNASAHVNLPKDVFHCKVCGEGVNAQQFIQKFFGCSYTESLRLKTLFETEEDIADWAKLELQPQTKAVATALGIPSQTIDELQLKSKIMGDLTKICFPVFAYDKLMDIRTYHPGGTPKVRSRKGEMAGLILPYDLWRVTPPSRLTLICAGEKDMAIARSQGFNAITITGGENALPVFINDFKDRQIAIVYDNDSAGKRGAQKLTNFFLDNGITKVRNVTAFHQICKEDGEDITDFFIKHKQTKEQLIQYIANTPYAEKTTLKQIYNTPQISLMEAASPKYINKLVQSNIQVVAVSEATFTIPSKFTLHKIKTADGILNKMTQGQQKTWELSGKNIQDILYLMDGNLKEETIQTNMRQLLNILKSEKYIQTIVDEQQTVFKANVADLFETQTIKDATPTLEFTAYSIGHKLESGKKYKVTHKVAPHPYKGNQLVMLIMDVETADDSVANFKLTDKTKNALQCIQNIDGNTEDKINKIVEKAKGLLGYDGNNILIAAIDLAFHTPLHFHFGAFKNERAYLDTLIVGESRIGKSSTANTLRETYELGTFASLAGNSATIPGLVGGSNKVNGSFQTRAGVIPQNHQGLIIFEEFGKSRQDITAELTDIRSSNKVRIMRVAGNLELPAMVRMITLTNVKNTNGLIKPIASYPNGIEIITELVNTAEDIARYDLILVLPDTGKIEINPLWQPQEPFAQDVYKTRVRWVWSRTADQIKFEDPEFLVQEANKLNAEYECHIKFFGTEAWKKLARLSIAIAGYVVSTDENYENIIVKQEHVEYAVNYFKQIYDNPTFRLKEYVTQEQRYKNIDAVGLANLKELWIKNASLLNQLELVTSVSKPVLEAMTGLETRELNAALKELTRNMLIRFDRNEIVPTERFRVGMRAINKKELSPIKEGSYDKM